MVWRGFDQPVPGTCDPDGDSDDDLVVGGGAGAGAGSGGASGAKKQCNGRDTNVLVSAYLGVVPGAIDPFFPTTGLESGPQVDFGTDDVAIEAWYQAPEVLNDPTRQWGNPPSDLNPPSAHYFSGIESQVVGAFSGLGWYPLGRLGLPRGDRDAVAVFDRNPGGGLYVTFTIPTPGTWFHLAINFDRSANMEVFLNNVSQGTVSIAAGSGDIMDAMLISPARPTVNSPPSWASGAPLTVNQMPVVVGPMAIHRGTLLDAAQRLNSINTRTVNALAQTVGLYYWSHKRTGVDAHDWDGDGVADPSQYYHTEEFFFDGVDADQAFLARLTAAVDGLHIGQQAENTVNKPCCTGTNIIVTDLSGSGNDLVLGAHFFDGPGDTRRNQSWAVFSYDQFFEELF